MSWTIIIARLASMVGTMTLGVERQDRAGLDGRRSDWAATLREIADALEKPK